MNYAVGFFHGVAFSIILTFAAKEHTIIYKDGYKQCIVDMELK